MSSPPPCPVCYTERPASGAAQCAACGYLFPETPEADVRESAPASAARTSKPFESARRLESGDLLECFKAQFIERRLTVPASWSKRLDKLASETEAGRRYATIIFVDLVGYTRLSQLLGEEDLKALRLWFNSICTTSVERHGGFLIQFLGDAAFAAFGAPWAFERDSEAAVRCLLDIRAQVAAHGEVQGQRLAIRGAASNGVINVDVVEEGGRRRPDLIGSPVNLAARLQSRAAVGEILIPEPLSRLVAPAFTLEIRESFEPKNYGEVVTPYAVLQAREGHIERRDHRIPFVGREAELEQLTNLLREAQRGIWRSALLTGDAGMGKTRLIQEALARVPDHFHVATLALEPHHRHLVLRPVELLIRHLELACDGSIPAVLPALTPSTMHVVDLLLDREAGRNALGSLPPRLLQVAVESALIELVRRFHGHHPLCLVIDDVQWCDELTMAMLEKLTARAPRGFVLILMGRGRAPDAFGEQQGAHMAERLRPHLRIDLDALPEEEALQLITAVTQARFLNPNQRRRVMEGAAGVPLFLVELAAGLEELPAGSEGPEILKSRLSLTEIFQARIDRLEKRQRLVLQCGAVLGRRFRETILSGYDELRDRLMEELALLKGARYLAEVSGEEDRELQFTPALVRDVAYEMLSVEQKRALHRRSAELIQSLFADRVDDFAVELCLHWLRAGELPLAMPWFRKACLRARRYGQPGEARRLALRALEHVAREQQPTPLLRQQKAMMLHQAGVAARQAEDYAGSRSHLQDFRMLARELGNRQWEFSAGVELALVAFEEGDLDLCEAWLAELPPTAAVPPAIAEEAEDVRAKILIRKGREEEALSIFLSQAERLDAGFPGPAGDAWSNAALCLQHLGRDAEAVPLLERARAAYARYGNPFGECIVLNNLGILREREGDFAAAAHLYGAGAALADRCSFLHAATALAANSSSLAYLQGRAAEAIDLAARSLEVARHIGHGNSEVIALINLGLGREAAGDLEGAAAALDEAAGLAEQQGDTAMANEAVLEIAWLALRGRDHDAAAQRLQQLAAVELPPDLAARREAMVALVRKEPLPEVSPAVSAQGRIRLAQLATVV